MKNIIKLLSAVVVMAAAIACDQSQEGPIFDYQSVDSTLAYFITKSTSAEFAGDATGTQTVELPLYRHNGDGALTVALEVETDADEFFSIPASATFADGEFMTTIPVQVLDVENLEKGATYKATISVPEKESGTLTATRYFTMEFSASAALEWIPVYKLKDYSKLLSTDLTDADYVLGDDGLPTPQTGTFYYNSFFAGDDPELTIERALGTNMFRINHLFYDIDFIFTIYPDEIVEFEGGQYMALHVDEQYIGYDHASYGPVYCADDYYLWGPADFADFPCFWDGNDTFLFHLAYFVSAGLFSYDTPEMFVLD